MEENNSPDPPKNETVTKMKSNYKEIKPGELTKAAQIKRDSRISARKTPTKLKQNKTKIQATNYVEECGIELNATVVALKVEWKTMVWDPKSVSEVDRIIKITIYTR